MGLEVAQPRMGWKLSGATVYNAVMAVANTWYDLDLSAIVGNHNALCYFEILASAAVHYTMKPKDFGAGVSAHSGEGDRGTCLHYSTLGTMYSYFICPTDSNGVLQHGATNNTSTMTLKLIGYIK